MTQTEMKEKVKKITTTEQENFVNIKSAAEI